MALDFLGIKVGVLAGFGVIFANRVDMWPLTVPNVADRDTSRNASNRRQDVRAERIFRHRHPILRYTLAPMGEGRSQFPRPEQWERRGYDWMEED
jgi:hypothetical protein